MPPRRINPILRRDDAACNWPMVLFRLTSFLFSIGWKVARKHRQAVAALWEFAADDITGRRRSLEDLSPSCLPERSRGVPVTSHMRARFEKGPGFAQGWFGDPSAQDASGRQGGVCLLRRIGGPIPLVPPRAQPRGPCDIAHASKVRKGTGPRSRMVRGSLGTGRLGKTGWTVLPRSFATRDPRGIPNAGLVHGFTDAPSMIARHLGDSSPCGFGMTGKGTDWC